MRTSHVLAALVLVLVACGGRKKQTTTPEREETAITTPAPHKAAVQDRAKQRHDAAVAIVPVGSTCLPAALKGDNAPRLELAGEGTDAVLCAVDTDPSRLLGTIGCWKIDLKNVDAKTNAPTLVYQDPAPLPGHDVDVLLDGAGGKCAGGYCLPDDAKLGDGKVAHMSWSLDGSKVAVLVGSDVHIFDAASKSHASSFNVAGDKGVAGTPSAVYFAGDAIFVEGRDDTDSIWGFKPDGTPIGPIENLGGKPGPISIVKGSFSIIDPSHVALADHGMETLTTYEIATGKRAKAVRKVTHLACKRAEIDTYYAGGDKVTDKCRAALDKSAAPLIGATAVMGKSNLLVVLHGDRLGELAVLEPKTLTESKKAFRLPWCDASGAAPGGAADADKKSDDDGSGPKSRGPVKKSSDPEEGGN